jgi:cobalt-zinc-cadmium efflux system outer membrane protein
MSLFTALCYIAGAMRCVVPVLLLGVLTVPAHAQDAASRNVAAPASLGSLSLTQAQELLRESNRQIQIARASFNVATREVARVDVAPNPVLNASVANTRARHYGFADSNRYLQIEQLIERGEKRKLRAGVARLAQGAAASELNEVTRQQHTELAAAYYSLVASQQSLAISERNLTEHRKLLEAAQRRLSAGDLAAIEVSRLRVEVSRVANDARGARQAVSDARITLALLLALEPHADGLRASDALPSLDAAANLLEPQILARHIAIALEGRADVRAAAQRVAAFDEALKLAQSLRTRDVTLGLHTERDPSLGGNVFGLSISVPLLLNNDFTGEILKARSEAELARNELERTQAAVRTDIDRARTRLESAQERGRRVAPEALPEARKAVEAVEFAFRKGAGSLTDLFDARRQYAAISNEAIAAHAQFATELSTLKLSLEIENSR